MLNDVLQEIEASLLKIIPDAITVKTIVQTVEYHASCQGQKLCPSCGIQVPSGRRYCVYRVCQLSRDRDRQKKSRAKKKSLASVIPS